MTTKRHFQDWISSYFEYAKDDFCPDQFHLWTGISILSAALERRVWLNEGPTRHFPNTFIMLVANPGVGKSTAILRGTELLELMRKDFTPAAHFKLLSGQMTQAGLMEEMKLLQSLGTNGSLFQYSSAYYYAPEASNSGLQNLAGDFNATITELYDCAPVMCKRLKEREYKIPNPSFCTLVGSTYDYLKNIVNQTSVMGGLASRFIYVQERERKEVQSLLGGTSRYIDPRMKYKLAEDLRTVYELRGDFKLERAAVDCYLEWWKGYQREYLATQSERMQSIITRKPTNLKKLMMIYSVSERNDLGITLEHVERAKKSVDEATRDNARIITSALIADKTSASSINQMIMQAIKEKGGSTTKKEVKLSYLCNGGEPTKFAPAFDFMIGAGALKCSDFNGDDCKIELLVDPDKIA